MIRAPLCLLLLFVSTAQAAEKWADPALPVKEGVWLWLDATRQISAWEANDKGLVGGEPLDVLYDASGNRRHFFQPHRDAQPKFLYGEKLAALRFDGKDDHLRFGAAESSLDQFTIFLVALPRTNSGGFRAFFAATELGKNDYASGFNIDLGPHAARDSFASETLNFEGRGFVGVKDLHKASLTFEDFHTIAFTVASGTDGIAAHVDGQPAEKRDRVPGKLRTDNMILGARCFSNEDIPPHLQGFLDGDIAEVVIYDRVLKDDERAAVGTYLTQKHEGAANVLNRPADPEQSVQRIENPPAVQMFVPGFSARKLPVDLTNINNLRYREDGKLVALGYDGNVYLLSDTDGDGLEETAALFWDNKSADEKSRIEQPIGMALTPAHYPRGRGLFVACKGKLSLIVDTDGDERADKQIVVATGWPLSFHGVDSLGVAIDPKDGGIYFGVGTSNFADPLLMDKQGKSNYDLKGERGTIMKVAADFSKREIICTGVRFSVGLAFNRDGDLFATDQEGATWVPNGNPLDELLHIQPGRHYGFPPRHPKHLPSVIDEPSTFDYAPQHQSVCGLFFNDPPSLTGGPIFGPDAWSGDAIVCGSSRGKLYLTKLARTPTGYVARNRIIGSMPMLMIDACLSPAGELVIAAHSGNPDWGSGPTGKGTLYKVAYRDKALPQPVMVWAASPSEIRIAFDRPLDSSQVKELAKNVSIDVGEFVAAGDRFEKIRPGYAVVKRQQRSPRRKLPITSVQIARDQRTVVLATPSQTQAVSYSVTLPGFGRAKASPGEIEQLDQIDLSGDLTGVSATWNSDDGKETWSGWLPHPDLSVARAFTSGSAQHDALWPLLRRPGKLTLRAGLDLRNMLQPAVQAGSQIDFIPEPEVVTVTFTGSVQKTMKLTPREGELAPVEIVVPTGGSDPGLHVSFITQEDSRPRPMALRRFFLPWAKLNAPSDDRIATAADTPELKGGDWLRGRQVFFGNEAACYKCHRVRGQGSDLGPDLSNLIHRDYESVMRDMRDPSGALNPDYIGSIVHLKDGQVLSGIVRNVDAGHIIVRGDAAGEKTPIALSAIKKTAPSPLSMMPTGLPEGLGAEKMRDLLTFLLTEPLQPAAIERKGAPAPRSRAEIGMVVGSATPQAATRQLNILLVAGAKDHGPSEHDYPAWQKRWTTLLGLAESVKVSQANEWPTAAQWADANVAVFYCANAAFNEAKAKDLEAHLSRGGGLVFIHMAVNGANSPEALAEHIGLAWRGGASKFRHGALALTIRDADHPITRGFDRINFIDESYWNLIGGQKRIHLLADGPEEGSPRPLLWTHEKGKGRVFVSIPGHYTWTFDDPLFRLLLLRGISWTAGEEADRLSGLATIGARVRP